MDVPPASWMQSSLALIKDRTLLEICLPASHDAGMSRRTGGTLFGTDSVVLTQCEPISKQLEHGIRLFDVRPVISNGTYVCGHYSKIKQDLLPGLIVSILESFQVDLGTWQGGNGQFIEEIVTEVNNFTAQSAELVILDCREWCGFNTDTDNTNYAWFDRQQWDGVVQLLSKLNNLYKVPAGQNTDLTTIKMKEFIGNGKSAVLCIVKDEVELGPLAHQGFFKGSQFNIPGDHKTWVTKEQGNQLENVLCILNDKGVWDNFAAGILVVPFKKGKSFGEMSVRGMARQVKSDTLPHIVAQVTKEKFPNQIWIDDVDSPEVTQVALEVIKKVCELSKV